MSFILSVLFFLLTFLLALANRNFRNDSLIPILEWSKKNYKWIIPLVLIGVVGCGITTKIVKWCQQHQSQVVETVSPPPPPPETSEPKIPIDIEFGIGDDKDPKDYCVVYDLSEKFTNIEEISRLKLAKDFEFKILGTSPAFTIRVCQQQPGQGKQKNGLLKKGTSFPVQEPFRFAIYANGSVVIIKPLVLSIK